jgi:hypothetical protein
MDVNRIIIVVVQHWPLAGAFVVLAIAARRTRTSLSPVLRAMAAVIAIPAVLVEAVIAFLRALLDWLRELDRERRGRRRRKDTLELARALEAANRRSRDLRPFLDYLERGPTTDTGVSAEAAGRPPAASASAGSQNVIDLRGDRKRDQPAPALPEPPTTASPDDPAPGTR